MAATAIEAAQDRGWRRIYFNALSIPSWGVHVLAIVGNSLSHVWGGRRYRTTDDSRNNPVLALITMGEGWHNNHHHYQVSARQGFFWWELDCTYYVLRALAAVGLIRDLHGVPEHVRDAAREAPPTEDRRAPLEPGIERPAHVA